MGNRINHLGSTMTMVDQYGAGSGPVFDYSPYGKQAEEEVSTDAPVTPTFTGKELDLFENDFAGEEDGEAWYYFDARYYDADVGVWTSTDVANQYFSPYTYCGDNPLLVIDKNGLYGREVHFSATLAMAEANGISHNVALQIANANQGFDEGTFTNPFDAPEFHFQQFGNNKMRSSLYGQAIEASKNGDATLFGQLMHQFQDTYSHEGFAPRRNILGKNVAWGHGATGGSIANFMLQKIVKPLTLGLVDIKVRDVDTYDLSTKRDQDMAHWSASLMENWNKNNPSE